VGRVERSIVRIRSTGCPQIHADGSGVRVTRDLIVTAAHVVAGSRATRVLNDVGSDVGGETRVVFMDRAQDVAVLRTSVGHSERVALRKVTSVSAGLAQVVFVGKPVANVRIVRPVIQSTTDIDLVKPVDRPGYQLDVSVKRGDSGAPLLVDGEVIGIVWARSQESGSRAWVVSIPGAIRDAIGRNEFASQVETGACIK
jgi:hypothetical protein